MRLFVSNVNFKVTEKELRALFESNGYVPVKLILCVDPDTGRSKGYAFVEVDQLQGVECIQEMDGQELAGRNIKVQMAREKASRR